MEPSENADRMAAFRNKIIGLGETSHRKSYYPQLRDQIRELNQAMLALQESENKYRSLVENVNIGIIQTEPWDDGRVIQANPAFCRMLGVNDEDELLDRPAVDMYLYPEARLELLKELEREGRIKDRNVVFKVKDGSTIMCSVSLSAQYDINGNMILVDVVAEDITEKEQRSEALRQANNKLNLLSSITRHDITNQVMILEGYLYLVMERVEDPDILMLLERMKVNVKSIDRHVMFAKDYQEIGIQAPQWVDLMDTLTGAMVSIDRTLIDLHIDVMDYSVFTDPMIKKVFYNLASNVIKHSNATNLTITTEEEGNNLLVVFQDDGIGIADKKRLFKKGSSSSGYGLFLSKEILSITGIGIRETGVPGEGARFEIVFSPGQYKTSV
ncbi:PAS domain S-box protein [Methanolobus profundi]|uniref:histidine kinase n=1 Tax=Methanolobus profundi TaxID=487685 RepID=A0A1I4SQ62_9EURY|nr:PAS domain-containing sensor histidine kinase [Methanolobus profundi]SFM66668.1 PAS domain S-box-containing protein [Methanolobus profundi]